MSSESASDYQQSPGIAYQECYERYLRQRPHPITSVYQYVQNLHRAARILNCAISPQLLPSPDAVKRVVAVMRQGQYQQEKFPMVQTALQRYADMVDENFEARFGVTSLSSQGRRLLAAILNYCKAHPVDYQNPDTFPSYDELYRAVNPNAPAVVRFVGHNLRKKGLDDLNEWTMTNRSLPKVTGLIVDKSTKRPGKGFFPSYKKTPVTDDAWWHEEARKALAYDWSPYTGSQQAISPIVVADDLDDDDIAKRVKGEISRIVRDTKIVREVKAFYEHTCQLCGMRLELKPGEYYSEAHHLHPLGKPHHGKDKIYNLICVCPNCHVKLDYHAVRIDPTKLTVKLGHTLSQKCIDHHNERCP